MENKEKIKHNPKNHHGHEGNSWHIWVFCSDESVWLGSSCSCGALFLSPDIKPIPPYWMKKNECAYQADPDDWRPWAKVVKERGEVPLLLENFILWKKRTKNK